LLITDKKEKALTNSVTAARQDRSKRKKIV
jgi:hypothetical protein